MENNEPQEATKKQSAFQKMFQIKYNPEELNHQVENYDSLPFHKSARGQGVLAVLFSITITLLFAYFVPEMGSVVGIAIVMLILYGIPTVFMYKGYRWGSAFLIVLWTLEKLSQIITTPRFLVGVFLWWLAFTTAFYRAYEVETERSKRAKAAVVPAEM